MLREEPLQRHESLCRQESLRRQEPLCGEKSLHAKIIEERERSAQDFIAGLILISLSDHANFVVSRVMNTLNSPPNLDLAGLSRAQIESMADAGTRLIESYRVLRKGGLNIVGEVLRDQDTFYEFEHYPKDDVFDEDSHSQYYYHAHRPEAGEHGHFHTFIRQPGMPEGVSPVAYSGEEEWPVGDQALTHLVAVAMDAYGFPIGLFATNRWLTAEAWYRAEDIIDMLDCFRIDHAYPSWPVNIWLSNLLILFRPQVEWLLRERDRVVAQWEKDHPGVDVYEDRRLDITSYLPINVETQIREVLAALGD